MLKEAMLNDKFYCTATDLSLDIFSCQKHYQKKASDLLLLYKIKKLRFLRQLY